MRVVFHEEQSPSFLLFRRLGSVMTPVFRPINVHTTCGRDLRAMVSRETGLPVGIFRLTNESGQEIFDCHVLESYGLELGSTVYLETWDGWNDVILASISGFTKQVGFKQNLSSQTAKYRYIRVQRCSSRVLGVSLSTHIPVLEVEDISLLALHT